MAKTTNTIQGKDIKICEEIEDGHVDGEGMEVRNVITKEDLVNDEGLGIKEIRGEARKSMDNMKGMYGNVFNSNVSEMFPKLNNSNLSKNNNKKNSLDRNLFEIPILYELNDFVGVISRIASRIGNPIIMDKVTTSMCERGYGRAIFARVLIEVNVANGFVESVEIWYRNLNRTMELRVEFLSEEEKIERNEARVEASTKSSSDPVGNQGKEQNGNNSEDKNVKFIAQRNFNTNNRFSALAEEEEEDRMNEWNGIKVNIDVAHGEKRKLLQNKIRILEGDISSRRNNIKLKSQKVANECVVYEMENIGNSRNQAYKLVYDDAYKNELVLIQDLTAEMFEFYQGRIAENGKDRNESSKGIVFEGTMEDEVGRDLSAHADFMTQNKVSSHVDASITNTLGWDSNVIDANLIASYDQKVQIELDKDPQYVKLKKDEMHLNSAYREVVLDEEKVLKQKTKVEWLKVYQDEDVAGFVSHFQTFLGTYDEVFPIEELDELFNNKLDPEIALSMIKEVFDEEIKATLNGIDDNKAPGPDGFTSRSKLQQKDFKKSNEDNKSRMEGVTGKDLCSAVREFFSSGKMLGKSNTTLIFLVPKCNNPMKVTDYRPIACCNVVYKCIIKVITNRIKVVLKDLIDTNQSAFIEGRQISHNIMVALELMCGYSRNKKIGRSSGLKPNMAKSIVFFKNVNDDVKRDIKTVMPFNEGMLLEVKYLGIPLNSNKISKSNCKVLLDNGIYEDVDKLLKNFLWRNDKKKSYGYQKETQDSRQDFKKDVGKVERNAGRTDKELFKVVFESIKSRLIGLKLKVAPDVIKATEVWSVPIDRMSKYKNILDELISDNMDSHKDNLPFMA
ncbi:RNA-directed DNA polymerase, eukaryota, reverse transcriptase zinc-binding domain protein [Tanacetum coccineum]